MFRWMLYRLLRPWGKTAAIPTAGGLVCATLQDYGRVSATFDALEC
jgi:hypothetical protein